MIVWRPGMLAVCIVQGGWTCRVRFLFFWRRRRAGGPRERDVVRVSHVVGGPDGLLYLGLNGFESRRVYDARCFRPLNEALQDAALIARIKAGGTRRRQHA